jgi:hypothetical protein
MGDCLAGLVLGNGRTRYPPYRRVIGLQFEDWADKMSTLQEVGRLGGTIFRWGGRLARHALAPLLARHCSVPTHQLSCHRKGYAAGVFDSPALTGF